MLESPLNKDLKILASESVEQNTEFNQAETVKV